MSALTDIKDKCQINVVVEETENRNVMLDPRQARSQIRTEI